MPMFLLLAYSLAILGWELTWRLQKQGPVAWFPSAVRMLMIGILIAANAVSLLLFLPELPAEIAFYGEARGFVAKLSFWMGIAVMIWMPATTAYYFIETCRSCTGRPLFGRRTYGLKG